MGKVKLFLLMALAIAFASANADYSAALQTLFAKGTIGASGKTSPMEMLFQTSSKNGESYSIIGKSKINGAEDAFSGTLSISSQIAGGSCASGEIEVKGSYDFKGKDGKANGRFIGKLTACGKNGIFSSASFKGFAIDSKGIKTPCDFELGHSFGALPYGGQTYKTLKIGNQTWMAENLSYNAKGSKCYDNKFANCEKYGRLYDWATAMAFPASCNSSECENQIKPRHKGICPQGWHIPSAEETNQLFRFVDSDKGAEEGEQTGDRYRSQTAGKYLKSKESWKDYEGKGGNGTDAYGFATFPGGLCFSEGSDCKFGGFGEIGGWWIAAENTDTGCYIGGIDAKDEAAVDNKFDKAFLMSIRCVKD